ncbi:MAG: hypothetical protein LH702_33035 [Phormidesmis sp. CAN_BIN44]|nr:hypothetical protein [Phormidesmis sp. CAN_BIN44]
MNFPGRIIGGTLVAIAVAWILNIAGVFPFNSRGNNQLAGDGANNPSIAPNNQQNRQGTQNYGAGNQGNGNTAQLPNTTNQPNAGSDGTAPINSDPNANPPAPSTPVVRGAW